jgi:hypothetical protein
MTARLPVVVRVKRKRELEPADTLVIEAEEGHASKRRARDAALAADLDEALSGAFGDADAGASSDAVGDAPGVSAATASSRVAASRRDPRERPSRRRFQRVQTTLSASDANEDGRVRELVHGATSRKRDFRMYDLECTARETPDARSGDSGNDGARRPMGRKWAPREADAPAPGTDDAGLDASTLMCDYMPMVKEYLESTQGSAAAAAAARPATDDDYVYDVYVQVDDDDETDDSATKVWSDAEDVVYVGGSDTELFFDVMNGLVDDGPDDDVDSEDSNREDAPFADYPSSRTSSDDERAWSDDDGGGYGAQGRRMRADDGWGVGGGYDSYDEIAGGDDDGEGMRQTAYDPDVEDDDLLDD